MKTIKSLVTLSLVNYPILRPGSTSSCLTQDRRDFAATVNLTVDQLDDKGYVTDNAPFIENTTRDLAKLQPKKVIAGLIDHAKSVLGGRLVRVEAILAQGGGTVARKEWNNPRRSIGAVNHAKSSFQELFVPVHLVDEAICGGYNGKFKCDLTITRRPNQKVDMDKVVHRVTSAFVGGPFKASCEDLAQAVTSVLAEKIPGITGATGRVYNLTGFAECTWRRGWEIPPFLREATEEEIEAHEIRKQNPTQEPEYC